MRLYHIPIDLEATNNIRPKTTGVYDFSQAKSLKIHDIGLYENDYKKRGVINKIWWFSLGI